MHTTRKHTARIAPGPRAGLLALAALGLLSLAAAPARAQTQDLFVSNFNSDTIARFAGTGPGTFATTGTDLSGGLSKPQGLVFDAQGDLFAANVGTGTITKFPAGPTPGSLGAGMVVETDLSYPVGLVFDKSGDLFVANLEANTITKFAAGTAPGTFGAAMTLTDPSLINPDGLAFDKSGNLFVSNQNGGSGSGSITEFVSTGVGTFGAVMTFTDPSLNFPDGIVFDMSGDLFVANQTGNSITEFAAGATSGTIFATGPNFPTGLAMDARGDLFAASYSEGTLTEYASTGAGTYAPGQIIETGLNGPTYIAFGAVAPAVTGTALTSSASPSSFGQAVTFTTTVTSSGGVPMGTVTFSDGGTVLGTAALNAQGQAGFLTTRLAPGAHSITAAFAGSSRFAASTSGTLTQTVTAPASPVLKVGVTVGRAGRDGNNATVAVTVFNLGTAPATVTLTRATLAQSSTALPPAFTLAAGASRVLTLTLGGVMAGRQSFRLALTATGSGLPSQNVSTGQFVAVP